MKLRRSVSALALVLGVSATLAIPPALAAEQVVETKRSIPVESATVTKHKTTIRGKKVSYTATAGMQPVWDEEGNPTATLQYTYYQRDDVKDTATRPLVISLVFSSLMATSLSVTF